ncbi:MAG TPA: YidC/Oxa1 family membrane protein insertase [Streptosporangiaceae bacterium]|nr:YidC/Oxa1 family membrane protein insertase [Streptosporangiaceae bacterium]
MAVFPDLLGVPVDAAYHVVSLTTQVLTPLSGGLAAAAAVVLVTMAVRLALLPLSYRATRGMAAQARLAPQMQALRKKHAGRPDRLQREMTALYQSEGVSPAAGCLPMLAQWPVLSVLYLLFRSPRIGRAPNSLLTHHLWAAALGSHWLGGPGPLSAQGAVFAGLFVLLAVVGGVSAWLARRAGVAGSPAAAPASGVPGAVARLVPYLSVPVAAFVPLAAGLYLVTTTAWTLAERALLGRVTPTRGAESAG